jgi:hypothetical protein
MSIRLSGGYTVISRLSKLPGRRVLSLLSGATLLLMLNSCGDYRSVESCADSIARGDKGRFEVNNEGFAKDTENDIIWYRCSAGQRYSNFRCKGEILYLEWDDAMAYAEEFSEKSGITWRVPTDREMQSVTEESCVAPAINHNVFPEIDVANHWTSSKSLHQDVFRCAVNTYSGRLSCRQARKIAQPFMLVRDE